MSGLKRVRNLGRQVVPEFARRATLYQTNPSGAGQASSPKVLIANPFNIACLCFYNRAGGIAGFIGPPVDGPPFAPLSYTFWANRISSGVRNIYGVSNVAVPPWSEYFSLSWMEPPDLYFTLNGMTPEGMFWIRWELTT